jgi:hypothetical protein
VNVGKNIIALEIISFCFLITYQSTGDVRISEVGETVTQIKINALYGAISLRNMQGTRVNRTCVFCTMHEINI